MSNIPRAPSRQETGYSLLSKYRSEFMGFASLWVMLFHAFYYQPAFAPVRFFKNLGFAGVDIFLLLSGMGLALSLARRKEEKLSAYFLRRAERILPSYWLVVGLYSLLLRLDGQISLTVAAWNLSTLHYWFHIPNSFNWYVSAALAFYLIAPFYRKLFLRCRHKEVLTGLLLPLSFGLYRLSPALGILHMQDFICRIPVFGLGILLGHYLLTRQELTRKHAVSWGCAVLCGIVFAIVSWKKILYIPTCYIIGLLLVPGLLLLANLLRRLRRDGLCRALRLLGECSLEIYLLNVIVTVEFDVLSPLFDLDPRHILYYCIVYLLNIVLGILLHKGMEKGKAALALRYRSRTTGN